MTASIIASILLVVALLACLPIQGVASAEWNETHEIRWRVIWAWGLLGLNFDRASGGVLTVFGQSTGLKLKPSPRQAKDAIPKEPKPQRQRPRFGSLFPKHGLRERHTWIDIVNRLTRALHWHCTVEGTIGLDDPADTALLATLVRAAPLVTGPQLEIDLVPDYLEDSVAISAQARLRVIPLELFCVLLRQALRAPVRGMLWSWWRK